jgi:hypothetical protein
VKIFPQPSKSAVDEISGKKHCPSDADDGLSFFELEHELAMMKVLSHPYMISLYDVWESNREM